MAKKETHDPLHVLVYGDAGARKSTLARTFPKPMRVCHFDPFGKDQPYLRAGIPGPLKSSSATGMLYREVFYKKNPKKVMIRIDYFHDDDAQNPQAWRAFTRNVMSEIHNHYDEWATIVFDSVTFMEIASRNDQKYRMNKNAKDPRQWYAASRESLEEILMVKCAGMPLNVVVIAHLSAYKDEVHGKSLYNPAAPGQLSKALPAGYAEFYRAYCETEDGVNTFYLQTQKSAMFNAASQIPAPNPCEPHYDALWEEQA